VAQNDALLRLEVTQSDNPKLSVSHPEIQEIVDRWLSLNPSIRSAILAIVRNTPIEGPAAPFPVSVSSIQPRIAPGVRAGI